MVSGVTIVPGMFFINDVVVRNNNGISGTYVAAGQENGTGIRTRSDSQNTILGSGHDGIYKSVDEQITKIELYHLMDEDNSAYNAQLYQWTLNLTKIIGCGLHQQSVLGTVW